MSKSYVESVENTRENQNNVEFSTWQRNFKIQNR